MTEKLAIDAGPAVRVHPFTQWPSFSEEEIDAVCTVLRSGRVNYWTGNECRRFEQEFQEFIGCEHAIAVANGTLALELALYALGIGPGDEVVVPSRTFIASASCVAMRGAVPIVADVDYDRQTITADTVKAVLSAKTKAIIAVHLGGAPCDMDPLMEVARERGLVVIEDCAQALGATYKGRRVGSLAHASAFSFCQDKILTTGGEGGMLTTNSHELWRRAWSFKDHGKNFEAMHSRDNVSTFRYVHDTFGTNWRLTEMQAAIGRLRLRRVDQEIAIRRCHSDRLRKSFLEHAGLRIPSNIEGHSYYKFYAFVLPDMLAAGWNRDRILCAINAEGIPCFGGSCSEIYLEKAFDTRPRPFGHLPIARQLGETSLMFLVHPTLTSDEIDDSCTAVHKVMREAQARTYSLAA